MNLWLKCSVLVLLCVTCSTGCAIRSRTLKRLTPVNRAHAADNNQAAAIANQVTAASVLSAQSVLQTAASPLTNRPVAEIPTNALSRVTVDLGTAQSAAVVTANLLERNQSLLGEPSTNQRPRVERLLSTNPPVRSAALKTEESRADAEGANVAEVQEAERKLIDLGQEAEKAKARSAWRRLWAWSIGTLGLGGTIALCVLFPAIIPILGQLPGWIVGMVPQLANWLGVVSVKAYQRSVSAFQEAKRKAALAGHQKTLEMLRQTAAENTESDADLVRQVKASAGYVKSETEIQNELMTT